jgi:manganese transport protein
MAGALTTAIPPRWKSAAAVFAPGCLVAVGYMDPGNWATSLAAGSQFGLGLLWVIALSNGVAMLMQSAAIRLGLVTGQDLAEACRIHFPQALNLLLWVSCEIAIAACGLAEVLGMAVALQMLFRLPLHLGVAMTVLDVSIILMLERFGWGWVEAVISGLVLMIAGCFAMEVLWLGPRLASLGTTQTIDGSALYLAAGIVGATVMPHNLYLHSSLVKRLRPARDLKVVLRDATLSSNVALALAGAVSAAILVLAAGAFFNGGSHKIDDLAEAHRLLAPALGVGAAGTVFALALLASGLSASVTGTLAGQIVMEGFLSLRMPPAARRLLGRAIAVVPAFFATWSQGAEGVGKLLVFSQVVLSMQLPLAVLPLLWFTTRRTVMGPMAFSRPLATLLWLCALGLIALNIAVLI